MKPRWVIIITVVLMASAVVLFAFARKIINISSPNNQVINTSTAKSRLAINTLIIGLHGGGGNGQRFALHTQLDQQVDPSTSIVIFPDALGGYWNDGRIRTKQLDITTRDDVGYITDLIKDTKLNYPNITKIALVGESNGGMMAQKAACDITGITYLVSVVANTPSPELDRKCINTNLSTTMLWFGDKDLLMPVGGSEDEGLIGGKVASRDDTIREWQKRLNCQDLGNVENITLSVTTSNYTCSESTLRVYRSSVGGHTWSGGAINQPALLVGPTDNSVSITTIVLNQILRQPI
jgi:polyhydroxybutyrate depolymerase